MPGTGLKLPDIKPLDVHRLDARRDVPKLTLSIYDLGNGQGFAIAYHDLESGELTEDGYMVGDFSTPFESVADAVRAGSDAYVYGGRVTVDCTSFSELDPEEFGLPVKQTPMSKLADDLSPDRTKMLTMIMLSLVEDSASRSPGQCVMDRIAHLLKPIHDRDTIIEMVDELQGTHSGVDADLEIYVELQKMGLVPLRIR